MIHLTDRTAAWWTSTYIKGMARETSMFFTSKMLCTRTLCCRRLEYILKIPCRAEAIGATGDQHICGGPIKAGDSAFWQVDLGDRLIPHCITVNCSYKKCTRQTISRALRQRLRLRRRGPTNAVDVQRTIFSHDTKNS